jgi:mono/diheme cytochrome c family protein
MRAVSLVLCLMIAACNRGPAPVTFDGALTADKAALIRHGDRLADVLGCRGCHGKDLQGTLQTKYQPQSGPLYASNLTVVVPQYTDAQLDAIIRHGTHPVRKTLWNMPSEIFQNIGDPDFKALIAYLRTLKPQGKKLPDPQFSALDRKNIAAGTYKPAVQLVEEFNRRQPMDLGPQYSLGRYITTVSCVECHGTDLSGGPAAGSSETVKAPNLIIAGAYSRADFERLMTQGVGTGGRKLDPAMYYVAIGRFAHLTPHERDALYAYLKARADRLSR